MTRRNEIMDALCEYLGVSDFVDHCVNGIQVEGSGTVTRIVTGVSVSQALFQAAIERNAEMVIVHHGLFWKSFSSPIALTGIMKQRVKLLLDHDMTLAAFHLPLDAHPVIGNNAQIIEKLGYSVDQKFDVGYLFKPDEPLHALALKDRLDGLLADPCRLFGKPDHLIRTVAVVSGGASHLAEQAARHGADALITGEVSEPAVRAADELGISLFGAGHYNTEQFGPRALAHYITEHLGIPAEFIDVPNEV